MMSRCRHVECSDLIGPPLPLIRLPAPSPRFTGRRNKRALLRPLLQRRASYQTRKGRCSTLICCMFLSFDRIRLKETCSRGRRRGWELAACPFAPLAGRRCRQADEGLSRIPLSAALRRPHPTLSGSRSASASA
ncbi:hypothetical protein SMB554_12270 [Sinorhizobium meliloti]|nr:hypothetical protein SMB554_12270 [Sinorhizobium meliloti]